MAFTYKDAGVDIEKADRFVSRISALVKETYRPEVLTDIGSFSALFRIDKERYMNPVLVSGTDGVGTKLKIAFLMDKHDTVGIDLVAMCVNDILTSGAEPLFFLDYIATGRLRLDISEEIIKGIIKGCKEAGCSLIGGETAEMPGFYNENEYDLCGFVVGIVERDEIVDGSSIKEGDVLIGIESNGLHSNGYSLVRKVLLEESKISLNSYYDELGSTLGEELLRPTKIYVSAVKLLKSGGVNIKGMAHITGGGITGNLPRIFPEGISAIIRKGSWNIPYIFRLIQKSGDISEEEMFRTFNMGIGYILVISKDVLKNVLDILNNNGYNSYLIGDIIRSDKKGVNYV